MNVELKRIAEKKLEQLGGDVCGVLVRKDGKLAAVDEHGRVTWLDENPASSEDHKSLVRRLDIALNGVEGAAKQASLCDIVAQAEKAARAQSGQSAEPVATVESIDPMNCSAVVRWNPSQNGVIPKEIDRIGTKLYTHPQPAQQGSVPEIIKAIADKLEKVEGESADGGYMWDARECAEFIREEADKLATTLRQRSVPEWVDSLRFLAEEATPGPWHGGHGACLDAVAVDYRDENDNSDRESFTSIGGHSRVICKAKATAWRDISQVVNDIRFISAANPKVILDLISLIPTTPQPEGDGWIKCSERLPEPRDSGRKAPNGILVKFDTGRITQIHDVTETLVARMKSGPRHPAKFEAPIPPRIVEWMDLDNPQPPKEGEGDE